MTFKNIPLTVRQGIYGKAQGEWDPSKVRIFKNKIDIYRQGCVEFACPLGRTTVVIEGIAPSDPGPVLGAWISNAETGDEIAFELARFGDMFTDPDMVTSFKAGKKVDQKRFKCSGYRRKVVFSIEGHITRVHLYVWTGKDWKEYGFFESRTPMQDGIFKIGLWGPTTYPTAYQGPNKFTVLSVEMGPI